MLSVGRLCGQGWVFNWPHNQQPRLLSPQGYEIRLNVLSNVPYIDVGETMRAIKRKSRSPIVPRIPLLPVVGEEEPTQEIQSEENPPLGVVDEVPTAPPVVDEHNQEDLVESTERNLRKEAVSRIHLMTHIPKNPY